ncbi:MAG TPA: hypothetical protein PKY82_12705 [Pyrinomonadaceae bacterium]|nr:hypothetical protein [Pyrinomonadaceae bacterium]
MQQTFEPIETEAGIIYGRDAIFLYSVHLGFHPRWVELTGELNNQLCSKLKDQEKIITYRLKFSGVLAFMMTELDCRDFLGESSFDLVINSDWINELQIRDSDSKLKPDHKHYIVFTYDEVFDIICQSYKMNLFEAS